ncbi:NAD(P)/FAD-dependent oxidoreductase [Cyanobium sp. CH-040]|uniref:NAD(P)/FAD-dependent oxidoreductase n=1 Tax=Cyanobium sp. CH-040 TaxID=2823708 RepID=UPI0020CC8582|nr:FAD-dependent oxidoreductase [Cyanobium sp. CH-040]MCP9927499.1 FAD-dependent monooxygenase [Cyanobium sp. CH-040]
MGSVGAGPGSEPDHGDTPHWDVVVVGAGPAGALASFDLARRGLRVLLVEKRRFPRWKVCGCCLNGQARAVLEALGLGELIERQGGVPLRGIRVGLGGRQADFPLPDGRALSRQRFDQALVRAAVSAGASFLPHTSARLGPATAGWRGVHLRAGGSREQRQVHAAVVLVAAGLAHRCLDGEPGTGVRIQPRSRVGAGCLLPATSDGYEPERIHMAVGRQGYVGLVRLEDGRLDLAAAFDRALLASAGGPAAAAAQVLEQAGFAVPAGLAGARWQGTPALTRQATPLAGERFLVLGDAAGYVEPFTGEGMGWALTAAAAATPLVLQGVRGWDPALERLWVRTLRRRLGRRQRLCRAVTALLRRPATAAALFALANRLPPLPRRLIRALNEPPSAPAPCPLPATLPWA